MPKRMGPDFLSGIRVHERRQTVNVPFRIDLDEGIQKFRDRIGTSGTDVDVNQRQANG